MKNISVNMKSTTIRIIIGDSNRTLHIEEINKVKQLFINHLNNNELQLR